MLSRYLQKLSDQKRSIFGFRLLPEKDALEAEKGAVTRANSFAENMELKKKLEVLEKENAGLRADVRAQEKIREIVDVFAGDPSPVGTEPRKAYVAQVAGLHREILEPKLKHMISRTLNMLEESSNDREYDQALKGTVYALRELIRWGEAMVNEQLSLQTQSEEVTTNKK